MKSFFIFALVMFSSTSHAEACGAVQDGYASYSVECNGRIVPGTSGTSHRDIADRALAETNANLRAGRAAQASIERLEEWRSQHPEWRTLRGEKLDENGYTVAMTREEYVTEMAKLGYPQTDEVKEPRNSPFSE